MELTLRNIRVFLPNTDRLLFLLPHLDIPKGHRILIRGPSGIGKTTLLQLRSGLFFPGEGDVIVGGRKLTAMTDAALKAAMSNSVMTPQSILVPTTDANGLL